MTSPPTDDDYRAVADARLYRHRFDRPPEVFYMDPLADVRFRGDKGAFVHCWVWVPADSARTRKMEWVITERGEELREVGSE